MVISRSFLLLLPLLPLLLLLAPTTSAFPPAPPLPPSPLCHPPSAPSSAFPLASPTQSSRLPSSLCLRACAAAPSWRRAPRPHVLLVGSPLAGKTTLGRGAAEMLGLHFADMDEERGGRATSGEVRLCEERER